MSREGDEENRGAGPPSQSGPKQINSPGQNPYVILTVAEAISADAGRGIARIDPEVTEKLKISTGDAIEILGKRHTFALCLEAHPRDAGKGLIRIDKYIRENAVVSIDDKVRVRKISAKYAQEVKLAPYEKLRIVGGEEYVKNILSGRIIAKGDSIPVRIMGRIVKLIVVEHKPETEGVIVNDDTSFTIEEEPVSVVAPMLFKGRKEQAQVLIASLIRNLPKLRERIEIALKHPELFLIFDIKPPSFLLSFSPTFRFGDGQLKAAMREIVRAISSDLSVNCFIYQRPEAGSAQVGIMEAGIRSVFDEARQKAPSIILIEDLDEIAQVHEVRPSDIATLLQSLMDGLSSFKVVILATARNANKITESEGRFWIPFVFSFAE